MLNDWSSPRSSQVVHSRPPNYANEVMTTTSDNPRRQTVARRSAQEIRKFVCSYLLASLSLNLSLWTMWSKSSPPDTYSITINKSEGVSRSSYNRITCGCFRSCLGVVLRTCGSVYFPVNGS